MNPLNPKEMDTLQLLLDRAIYHQQLLIGAPEKGNPQVSHATDQIACACDHVERMIIDITPAGLRNPMALKAIGFSLSRLLINWFAVQVRTGAPLQNQALTQLPASESVGCINRNAHNFRALLDVARRW
jgi:hypothetical protein